MGFAEKNSAPSTFDADTKKLQDNIQKLDESLDGIFSVLDKKVSFDELCDTVSSEIDGFITKCESEQSLSFIGGSCMFKVTGFVKKCSISADLYFMDDKKEYTKATMSGVLPFSKFTDESVKTDLAEIAKNKGLKVDIEHP